MPDFDPYLTWLGIPPTQRPPTYYQLLGVDPSIDDPDVVKALAIQKIAYVRNFQRGEHGDLCARILEELAAAERVLVDRTLRAEYDRTLRPTESQAPALSKAGARKAKERPTSLKTAAARIDDEPIRKPRGKKRRRSEINPFAAVVGAVTAAVVLGVVFSVIARLQRNRSEASLNKGDAGGFSTAEASRPPSRITAEPQKGASKKMEASYFRVEPETADARVAKGAAEISREGGTLVLNATPDAYRDGIEVVVSADGFKSKSIAVEPPQENSPKRTVDVNLEQEDLGIPNSPTAGPDERVFVKFVVTPSYAAVEVSRGKARLIQIPRQSGRELIVAALRQEIEDGIELKISLPDLPSFGFRYLIHPDQDGRKHQRMIFEKKSDGWWSWYPKN